MDFVLDYAKVNAKAVHATTNRIRATDVKQGEFAGHSVPSITLTSRLTLSSNANAA